MSAAGQRLSWAAILTAVGCALMLPGAATANPACVTDYYMSGPQTTNSDVAAKDIEELVRRIAAAIGLQGNNIVVVPCRSVSMVQAYYPDRCSADWCELKQSNGRANEEVPENEYIIYDPVWVRQVIGTDITQAYALFGHELGHFLNRHFTSLKKEKKIEKELQADRFAGCAVARMGGQLDKLEDLLRRLRDKEDGTYPSRDKSLREAKSGFEGCSGQTTKQPTTPAPTTVTYKVCSGEYQNRCQAHDAYLYCYSDVTAWAKSKCENYTVQRLSTYGGNKCGYSIDAVICTGPR